MGKRQEQHVCQDIDGLPSHCFFECIRHQRYEFPKQFPNGAESYQRCIGGGSRSCED